MTETEREILDGFMTALHYNVEYWLKQDCHIKEKMEGLTFSILVMLDGDSNFSGNIEDLYKLDVALHEHFYFYVEKKHCCTNFSSVTHSNSDGFWLDTYEDEKLSGVFQRILISYCPFCGEKA